MRGRDGGGTVAIMTNAAMRLFLVVDRDGCRDSGHEDERSCRSTSK
jgi:hypothetical protein